MLLLADGLEQQHSPIHVDIDEIGLPMGGAHLDSLNLKRPAFSDASENPETEIDILYQKPIQPHQPFLLGIDQDRSSDTPEGLGFHCGGTNAGSGQKLSRI